MAFVIAVAVMATAFVVDRGHTTKHRKELRTATETAGNLIAQRLASRVKDDLLSSDLLRHAFQEDAAHSAQAFEHQVKRELVRVAHFSAVAIAPGFNLANVITREGPTRNTSRLPDGVDLARLARDLKSSSNLRQPSLISGTQADHLTLVLPVLSQHGDRPWGAIAVLIEEKKFLETAGVPFPSGPARPMDLNDLGWLDVAIRETERPEYLAFFGDDAIEGRSPVAVHVPVDVANWTLLAVPRSGWESTPANQRNFRLAITLAALSVIVPIFAATSLITERNRNIAALKARELKLRDLSQRFNLAMEASNIGIWEVTGDEHILFWDTRAARLHGCNSTQDQNSGTTWIESIYPEDRAAAENHFHQCIGSSSPCSEVYRVQLPDGAQRYLRSAGASYPNADGSRRTTGIVWDVTADMVMAQTLRDARDNTEIKNAELELALDELSNSEQELEELSTKLDLALASSNCGIWEANPQTHVEIWDARMCQLHGIPFTDGVVHAEHWLSLLHPDDREAARQSSFHAQGSFRPDSLVVRVPMADGSIRYIRSIGKLHTTRSGAQKVVGIAFDITQDAVLAEELKLAKEEADAKNVELELAKSRIEHNSLHDPLTLLANRRKLDLELDRISQASRHERQHFTVLHLDLDRFKQINDTLGHAAGDAMLVHASRILSRNVGASDVVARIGGDEFVILSLGNSGRDEIAELAQSIVAEFHQAVDFEGFSCRCGVSIGIARASGMNIDARRTLINADIALYRAKSLGRNRYEFFTPNLQAEIVSHKRTADELLAGIDNHEFTAWYQPQFDARSHAFAGVEALIRWNHPHQGVLAPDRFLKIAEDLNVSAVLDQMVLENVLKDKMRWASLGVRMPRVSVNVSAKRLHDDNLIGALEGLQISPGEISFELVESIFLDESDDVAAANLERIKELGIDIEIDDFGTGHTSIVSLLKLKPKRLKIDRQLVMPIVGSPQERALVRSIIDIARSLGVETVAEGVETMQHAALLRDWGCDLLQGYAFARPLSFEDFTRSAGRGWHRAAA